MNNITFKEEKRSLSEESSAILRFSILDEI